MSSVPLQASVGPAQETFMPPAAASAAHEAARYAVLRRIGSAVRHQIAGALQPVSMMSSMLERRLQADAPNLDTLRRNSGEMSLLARNASAECVALLSWLAPPADERVSLQQAVEDCLHLLTTELSFRGFALSSSVGEESALVCRPQVRTLLVASLLALTDSAPRGGEVQVSAVRHGARVLLRVVRGAGSEADEPALPGKGYRALGWADVRALAESEEVRLDVEDDGVLIHVPVLPPKEAPAREPRWA